MSIRNEINHTLMLATRDLLKFLRDRGRIVGTFLFPIIFMSIFAVTLDAGIGQANLGFSYVDYVFSGIILQTVFQSSFMGIVSLVADREKDFSMSIFVSPISRGSIVFGKIFGETLVSMVQVLGLILFGVIMGVHFSPLGLLSIIPFSFLASLVGGSFGILIASQVNNQEGANRIFPFMVFPMIFLSGAFTPVNNLPIILDILKTINPLYYGVDLMRNILYWGRPEYARVVANAAGYDALIFFGLGFFFFVLGTYLFTNKEGNR